MTTESVAIFSIELLRCGACASSGAVATFANAEGLAVSSPMQSATGQSGTRFEALDGLRALAMLAVFGYHFGLGIFSVMEWHDIGYRIVPNLDVGVEIFFVLSGFLIFRPFAAANLQSGPRPVLRHYFIRRALRIYPAYWVALTAFLLFDEVRIHGGVGAYLAHYALLHTYRPQSLGNAFDGIGPSWSLVVEVSFYAVVPFIAWLLRCVSQGGHLAALAALWLGGLAVRYITVDHPMNGTWHGYLKSFVGVLPMAMAALAPGMMLAVLTVREHARLARGAQRLWPYWLVALGLFGVLMWKAPTGVFDPFRHEGSPQSRWHTMVTPLIAILLVGPVVLGPPRIGVVRALLRSRVAVWLGTVSFGAYLWHHPLLLDSKKSFGDHVRLPVQWLLHRPVVAALGIGFLFLIATFICAGISWYAVERPMQSLGRRLTRPVRAP